MGTLYQYTTVSNDGRPLQGLVYGESPQEAQRQLPFSPILLMMPLSLRSISTAITFLATLRQKPSPDILLPFFTGLRLMTQEGVPLWEAVHELSHLMKGPRSYAAYMMYIETQLKDGASIAKAFQVPLFPEWIPLLLDLGEKTSRLLEVIHHIERLLELKQRLKIQARKMLSYPFFLLFFLVGGGLLMSFFDQNLALMGDGEVNTISEASPPFLPWGVAILALILGALGNPWSRRLQKHQHRLLLRLPGLRSFESHRQGSLWSFALALALESHLPLHEALDLSKRFVSNLALQADLDEVAKKLLQGHPLSEGIAQTSFPPMAHRLCLMGESSGSLPDALLLIHRLCDSTVDRWIDRAFRLLAPTLTLISGGILLLMAWRFLLPLYEMMIEMGRQMP